MARLPYVVSVGILVGSIAFIAWMVIAIQTASFNPSGDGGWFKQNPQIEPVSSMANSIGTFGLIGVAFVFRDKLASLGLAILANAGNIMDYTVISTGAGSWDFLTGPDLPIAFILRPVSVLFILFYVFGASRKWLYFGTAGILISYPLWQLIPNPEVCPAQYSGCP